MDSKQSVKQKKENNITPLKINKYYFIPHVEGDGRRVTMDRIILSSGKMQLGDCQVDIHIYYNFGDGVRPHYSFDINPQVRDEHQPTFHIGETMMADTLEDLMAHMELYQRDFRHIVEQRDNGMFDKLHID